jgi:hypothetical protein
MDAPLEAHFDIRLLKKIFHLLVVLPAKQVFPPEFRHTSPSRHFFNALWRYD